MHLPLLSKYQRQHSVTNLSHFCIFQVILGGRQEKGYDSWIPQDCNIVCVCVCRMMEVTYYQDKWMPNATVHLLVCGSCLCSRLLLLLRLLLCDEKDFFEHRDDHIEIFKF